MEAALFTMHEPLAGTTAAPACIYQASIPGGALLNSISICSTPRGAIEKRTKGEAGGQDREIARGGKWDMTTVLSVTTPPIVWPKKRASTA
ncbi:hypothetical protein NQZ68_031925, partial [Dissostichus eleginoides]